MSQSDENLGIAPLVHMRVARPTDNMDEVVRFYRDGRRRGRMPRGHSARMVGQRQRVMTL